ncbi:prolyl aminopeptidase [Hyphobacterium sp.]|uniref:prolyl aminopeptidase n=1 Tax=Hyphobacterium sp. TaxID=2004662 RepID=UPI003BAAF852
MSFFPEQKPFQTGHLETGDGHRLYWERCGKQGGVPAVFLHGGPGSGCTPKYRRFFDPERFDLVLFDQRGCGRSAPLYSLKNNTTQHLISDIEALRISMGVEKWIVMGPSWGSTLALAYSQAHPASVSGLLVEGVFLGSNDELAWWHTRPGAPNLFPDAFKDFLAGKAGPQKSAINSFFEEAVAIMQSEIADGLRSMDGLESGKATLSELRRSLLYRWTEYEDRISWLDMSADEVRTGLAARGKAFIATHSLIEAHYFAHRCFLRENQLLDDARKLDGIAMEIINSRYDVVCPPRTAHQLADACPHARLTLVPNNGHAMTESMFPYVREALERLAKAAA